MATVRSFPVPAASDEGVLAPARRLLRLEFELAVAETREILVAGATAIASGVVGAFTLLAALIVLLAALLAPLFDARWQHLAIAGGLAFVAAAAALGWSAWRLTRLGWPHLTLTSLEETWQWLEAQLKSRLRLR